MKRLCYDLNTPKSRNWVSGVLNKDSILNNFKLFQKQRLKTYLSSKTIIISPCLKVSSLSSTASKSYKALTFLAPLLFNWISADGYKDLVSVCCCFCSCSDNSIASLKNENTGKKTSRINSDFFKFIKKY